MMPPGSVGEVVKNPETRDWALGTGEQHFLTRNSVMEGRKEQNRKNERNRQNAWRREIPRQRISVLSNFSFMSIKLYTDLAC